MASEEEERRRDAQWVRGQRKMYDWIGAIVLVVGFGFLIYGFVLGKL